ncbi:MAG: hypothetical protein F7B61_03740, partial [Caldisphaeraceae archaeon]|nr:hypothetical protein [Caldisphaeraceae archaeon]
LAIYPTITLEKDQLDRIKNFYSATVMDGSNKELKMGAKIVLTNPAFLMTVMKTGRGNLMDFIRLLNLVVIDELSFYNTGQIQMLLELLSLIYKKNSSFQVAVLTATIDNIDVLSKSISSVNERETAVIYGKRFGRRNVTRIFKSIRSLDDIISSISKIDVKTIVFVPTINIAEVFKRKSKSIGTKLTCESHHSMISRDDRNKIEEGFKSGNLNCLVSPKTLELGVDIGSVERIVHIGLPLDPSDYMQREGRKGRRFTIKETYTDIFPFNKQGPANTTRYKFFHGVAFLGELWVYNSRQQQIHRTLQATL